MMFRPNKPATVELFDAIRNDVYEAMVAVGTDVVADIQDRLSVDVEYVEGPRGGVRVIRSLPGESPRRETTVLQSSIQSAVETDANVVELTVFSDCEYAGFLEFGTERIAARPAFEPALDAAAEDFFDRVTAAVAGK